MMSPVRDPATQPDVLKQARVAVNRAYVRELLAERQPDFARELRLAELLIRTHRCEHANHS
jgi:hypothetical protein